jgi:hypothetical protein
LPNGLQGLFDGKRGQAPLYEVEVMEEWNSGIMEEWNDGKAMR